MLTCNKAEKHKGSRTLCRKHLQTQLLQEELDFHLASNRSLRKPQAVITCFIKLEHHSKGLKVYEFIYSLPSVIFKMHGDGSKQEEEHNIFHFLLNIR